MSPMSEQPLGVAIFMAITAVTLYQSNQILAKKAKRNANKLYFSAKPTPKSADDKEKPTRRLSQSDVVPLPGENEHLSGFRILPGAGVNEIRLYDINCLRNTFASDGVESNIHGTYNRIMGEEDYILSDIVRKHRLADKRSSDAFVRGGPRSITHFDPANVRAAIVTCGGLCPGLNSVIRELTHTLHFLYDAAEVIGIIGGYAGFSGKKGYEPIKLTVENTADIHHQGGTILASSRGGFDIEAIIKFLTERRVNQLYVIGGDGTHRGAYIISEELIKRKMNVAVVGIPKTIDNDVDIIDRSFGFTTAVEAAQAAILSAKTEAK